MTPQQRLTRVRAWLSIFVIGLIISGFTAFPLVTEVHWASDRLHGTSLPVPSALLSWIDHVKIGLEAANADYPFLFYGTDWLAFAHLMIALAFIGPLRDPVRNIWVIQWGMLACVAVVPLALIAGPIRGIPFWWQLIDISFGVIGIIPLLLAYRQVRAMATGGAGS